MSEVILWTLDEGNTINTLGTSSRHLSIKICNNFARTQKLALQSLLSKINNIKIFQLSDYGKTKVEGGENETKV